MPGSHDKATALLSRRGVLLGALAAPALLRASTITPPTAHAITRWRSDPYAYGSYSFLARGADPSQRRDLAAPLGPLFFAGEATSSDHPSTVHGALLSGRRAARDIIATGRRRIAIIGAGFAGLGAAAALHAAGVEVEVIDARDRIGGRVHSADLAGATIDLGASWIHGTQDNPLTALAQETRTETRITDWSALHLFNENGRRRFLPFLPRAAQEVEVSHAYGADFADLSPDAFDEGDEFGGDEVTFPQGYGSLLPSLTTGYTITLGKPVRRIDWTPDGGATLTLRGGRRAYDGALITVPLGVLKSGDITFAPALPPEKETAIADLGMGHLSKVFLRFDAPFWNEDLHAFVYLGEDPTRFATWINIAKTNDAPILMAFHGGSAADALEERPDADIIEDAMDVLTTIWG
ncbi:MAG: FAD-dependent oxidoreductase [Pseudomonadota bacterium]